MQKNRLLIVALLFATLPFATGAAAEALNYRVVSLSANAEREVPNDLMRVQLMVEHQAPRAADVAQKVNADMSWALDALKGERKLKYETRQYSTYPMYNKHKIKGWRASQQLLIESEDFARLSNVILRLQDRLQVKDMRFAPTRATRKRVEDALIGEALEAFKARARLVQENMQSSAYQLVDLSVNTQGHYEPMYRSNMKMMAMSADAAPAVAGGTSNMTVSVSGQIQLQ